MIQKYLYLRLCINTAFGHLQVPLTVMDKVLTLGIFLKVFGLNVQWIMTTVGVVGVVLLIYFGHLMVRYKVVERDNSLSQTYNKEFQEILEFVRSQKK